MKIKWTKIIKFKWFKRLYVLYIFGFVFNFRPSIPFFFDFLTTNKNIQQEKISNEIVPILFYTASLCLLPVTFLMEIVHFTPLIILSTVFGVVSVCLYIWTNSLESLQIAHGFNGLVTATEIAYHVCIYAHGDEKNYQKLTSYVRAAPLAATVFATFLSQLFISLEWFSYKDLYFFNLAAFIAAAGIAIILTLVLLNENERSKKSAQNMFQFKETLKNSYPNKYVVKWTLWSILSLCGYNNFTSYLQPLWKEVQSNSSDGTLIYNGALEGLYSLSALIATILAGYTKLDWKFKGDLILSMTSLVVAFMLLFMAQLTNTLLQCGCYLFLGFIHHLVLTVLYAEIAKFLTKGYFGLVFGVIAFGGWTLSAGMTIFLTTNFVDLFNSNFQNLFMFYGFYFLFISILFIVIGLSYWFAKHTYQ